MTEHKLKLTTNLLNIRSNLSQKHKRLLRQLLEVESQIEATDRLLKVHNPEHIALPMRASSSNLTSNQLPRLQLPPAPTTKNPSKSSTMVVKRSEAPDRSSHEEDIRNRTSAYLSTFDKHYALLTVLNTMDRPIRTSEVSEAILRLYPEQWPEGMTLSILNSRLSAILFRLYTYGTVDKTDGATSGGYKISYWQISEKGRGELTERYNQIENRTHQ